MNRPACRRTSIVTVPDSDADNAATTVESCPKPDIALCASFQPQSPEPAPTQGHEERFSAEPDKSRLGISRLAQIQGQVADSFS